MHVPTSLFAAVLAFVAFDQASALCKWDRCCYTNPKGPGACPVSFTLFYSPASGAQNFASLF
ncbi:hypothetical protein MCOR27_004168 [Pyricularia oryzae]|uniref:Uncharacterized protein n=2 Tax=Pyricularia TaxID=48558 RepID=A0ABQ8N7F1_PYRGI|nr:hypothetical protein MCOR01_001980 [Pyricularia oryzae]KAI6292145.1 hypothetical protein MCOR33_010066 [Pyricularia grisea]KAH9429446.1 hypothetical protein MCOR02_010848 [Pyricularia oryzae]KAI6257833.1 hypothetical protein MCOR19_005777 [Pyricularia oryzae]KAI6272917.1 hypothetical protein MCOR26_007146 [Pyricularia oryzae]